MSERVQNNYVIYIFFISSLFKSCIENFLSTSAIDTIDLESLYEINKQTNKGV